MESKRVSGVTPRNVDAFVRGYFDGLRSRLKNLPEILKRRSLAYKHGWGAGRDDRMLTPTKAETMRRRAAMIAENTDCQ